jgi:hypothetical protein
VSHVMEEAAKVMFNTGVLMAVLLIEGMIDLRWRFVFWGPWLYSCVGLLISAFILIRSLIWGIRTIVKSRTCKGLSIPLTIRMDFMIMMILSLNSIAIAFLLIELENELA